MKWSIWIQPNRIIEEEYPDGWTRDEVFEAASNRWAGKVTTVNPAPVGGSRNDDNSHHGGEFVGCSGCFGFIFGLFKLAILLVFGVAALALFFPSEDNKENNRPAQTTQQSQVRQNSFTSSLLNTLDDIDRN